MLLHHRVALHLKALQCSFLPCHLQEAHREFSGPFVSAHGGSTSYGGSFQSQSLSTKYTPGSQHLPYDAGVAGQGTSSASEVLSSYSSMNNRMLLLNHPTRSRAKRLW